MTFDYLIVGAGIAGLTFAERACAAGKRCLVVDRRPHIGGNCYDRPSEVGVLVHAYGPHYFRTQSPRIVEYFSQFTEWRPVDYKIQSWTHGRYWSFPINLNTFEQWLGRASSTEEFEAWLAAHRVPIAQPSNSEEVIISQVGWEFYRLFFEGYTLKQWKVHPRDLDASVCGRIPIRTNRDDRYLRESFQALPVDGYTRMFERMVAACGDRLEIRLETDYRQLSAGLRGLRTVYTGPIDDYYGLRYGPLPYRSLRFEEQSFTGAGLVGRLPVAGKSGFWQPAMQVNYPNDEAFTRIVEIKHATGQQCAGTTIMREFPEDYGPGKEPYYPVPTAASAARYQQYRALAECELNTVFIGRLATYRYYNMDQVVGMALAAVDREPGLAATLDARSGL
jgi:UDP-galactopyranose mutase